MKKLIKRFLPFLLAVLMLAAMAPSAVFAAESDYVSEETGVDVDTVFDEAAMAAQPLTISLTIMRSEDM